MIDLALKHLELLGYKDGDRVYLRPITSSGKAQNVTVTYPTLRTLPKKQNVYFVVNGGGNSDADVTECCAIFYEHDNLDKLVQRDLWRSLGLPEPTFQIDTGGKSIHSYWVFDQPIGVDEWRSLQSDFLEFANADRSIKNPSRVMRLAGSIHQGTGQQATTITQSEQRYSYQELRAVIPEQAKPERKQRPQQALPVGVMPLRVVLSPAERKLIEQGAGDGERNDRGAALARGLLGAENWLRASGIAYEGNAEAYFQDYCERCSPPLDLREAAKIWRSAEGDNPTSTLSPEKLVNCVQSWERKQTKSATKRKAAPVAEVETDNVQPSDGEGKPHFESSPEKGLFWVSYEKDEDSGEFKRSRTKVGNHLEAIAYIENTEESGAALLLEFKTVRGHIRRWQMPRNGLAGNASLILDELLSRGYGLVFEQTKKLKRYLIELGQGIDQTYTITNKTGWVGDSFVLENRTYGDQSIRFLDVEPVKDSAYELRGTLDSWRNEVASLAASNSRLIFGLGVTFAAPLAPVLGVESGGFHLYGPTSTGKTTTLKIASSVVGIPSKEIKCWRATANGLEGVASAHNHLPLHLDEIGQGEPRDVGATAYMLSNGQGKTRARRNGDSAPSKTWDTLFFSSGEVGLSQYLKQAGISVKGGQEIRMPDIPACPDNGQGVLESISNFATPADFIRALEGAVERNCGTALDAFLTGLVKDRKSEEWVKEQVNRLRGIAHKLREVAPTEEIIGRVALRFALMQVALEVAHSYGILPFPIEQCGWAVQTLFTDWLNARGGAGSIEIKQACERIEHLFVSNEFGDRIYRVDEVSRDQNVRNLLAYRKTDPLDSSPEFWVPTSVFNSEFCQGIEKTLLINELLERGWLKPSTQPDRKTVKRRLGTRTLNVYAFRIFWDSCLALGTTGTVGTSIQDKESSRSQPWEHAGNNGNTPDPNADNVPVVPKGEMGAGTEREQQNPCPELVSDSVPDVPVVPSPKQQNPKNNTLEKIDEDIDWIDINPDDLGGAA